MYLGLHTYMYTDKLSVGTLTLLTITIIVSLIFDYYHNQLCYNLLYGSCDPVVIHSGLISYIAL